MLSSSTALSLSNFPPKRPRIQPSPEIPTSLNSSTPTNTKNPNSLSLPDEPNRKPNKGSARLKQWSRARAIRLGRRFDRLGRSQVAVAEPETRDEGNAASTDETLAKSIYIVSDGTGWTAENSVNAALGQFEYCLVDRGCPVNTHLCSGVEDIERLLDIVKQAAKEGAMVVYTLADPSMAESARTACRLWAVPSIDVLGPVIEAISTHLGVSPLGLPRGASGRRHLTDEYFRRIEAIEFTIKQDDGALPHNLEKADIVLAGVSRTGKTPLSIYLAQKGYKVANVPIVMGVDLPPTLFRVDPRKVFGLIINPVVLQTIRKERARTLGLDDDIRSSYSEMDSVRRELEHAGKIFAQNPIWPVIEVTGKAVEETAAVLLRLYYDKMNKCSMPGISKRY